MCVKTKPRFLLFVLLLLFVSHRTCFSIVDKTIVWVANRESPAYDPASSTLELSDDGFLVLLTNFTETVWSTFTWEFSARASSVPNTSKAEAVLLDDGNFVDGCNNSIGWNINGVGDLINLQQHSEVADDRAGAEIYIRLAASELELQIGNGSTRTGNIKRTIRTTLAVAIPTTLITFGLFMYFRCLRKGKAHYTEVHPGSFFNSVVCW
ncbi:hypothetical protein D5086_009744 [Populus alba]|uniref:Uncharacterized protein n=1 Tax=Populus alba TaxID=43335 RepID=A0ACC4C7Q6_POPAL